DMGDIMMLMNAPMPRGFVPTEDVCRGVGLDNILRQSRLEKNILEGLRNQSFEVFYQPIYTSRNMSICAGEALLRLHDAEAGEIYPDEFLPVAERGGLIFELGDFVLEEVCKFLNSGIPVEMGIDCFHINLSVVQCIQQNYAEHIMEVVSKYQIDPARIDFEIMESAAAADLNALQAFVRKLRSYGFSFSVNDYGIGYSHVHSIFHLDIDTVKIDKSILREAESSETGRIIMESSVEMIKRMGKKIIISGVENQSQVDLANEFAIDYLQGFFFSNPVSQNEFINVLKASRLARMEEQKAIASNEAMSSFLANMSHEIRTPINAVLGMDEMILRESKDEKVLGYAKTIESAGRTLLSLINDVLDFSKIESGKMDILCAEYDLGQVLLDVMAMVRVKAKEKNLGLHLDADPELYYDLMGDEVRLRQVLLNLLNNAVKYTKTGSVTLKVRGHKQKDETLKLEISVKDTGIGIRPEDQEKLFEKFSRLDIDKNKTVEGTGLGLAITSQILSLMEGEIRVESTYGKGSEFIVTLDQEIAGPDRLGDMTQREKKLEKHKQKPRAFRAPAARILVVDDTSLNHVVVRELLSDTEITIDATDSGQGALEMVRRDPYDLILLDYRMPGMNGIETIHAMKELPGMVSPEAPVVALTANAVFGAKERFIREGFTDYITKPVSGERLEEVLLSYLPDEKIEWIDEKESGSREEDTAAGEEISTGAPDGPVDVETGIRNCGNRESYIKVLKVFMTDVESKSKLLRESFDKKDWERYGIEVHAIKSSGRIIGATQLSQKAQELEHAAEEADEAFIGENHEAFLSLYEGICGREELRELCGCHKGDDKPVLTEEAFREALEAMHDFCLNMDEKNADYILSSLRDYTLSKEQEGKVARIEELLTHLEWEQLRSLLEDKI
ncbi:MAG: EAL domain-containing protein, partial [Lachnospiraceae bacterium]|nr:EAL domain-containing protein [Lachnospiraceae bacterium]